VGAGAAGQTGQTPPRWRTPQAAPDACRACGDAEHWVGTQEAAWRTPPAAFCCRERRWCVPRAAPAAVRGERCRYLMERLLEFLDMEVGGLTD